MLTDVVNKVRTLQALQEALWNGCGEPLYDELRWAQDEHLVVVDEPSKPNRICSRRLLLII